MSLPTFDGTYEQWPTFFSTFLALVDKNHNLSNVHKFFYLQSALDANSKKIIESLEVNEVNYSRAIKLLKGRFDNSRLATRHHARAIFNLKQIEKESSSKLRNLTDCLKQHLEALKALKYETETWCPLIIEWVLTRLDSVTVREWEEKTIHKKEYKTKEFIAFLEDKCNMLEGVRVLDSVTKESEKSIKKGKGVAHITNQSKLSCPVCKKEHKVYFCDSFKNLSVQSRVAEARKLKLCLNCLNTNHLVRDCRSSMCRYCGNKHHSLLHYNSSDSLNKGETVEVKSDEKNSATNSIVTCANQKTTPEVLLSTAEVHIVHKYGRLHTACALLDNGSTLNFCYVQP
ncbi:hypothetical protein ALC57_12866 [Trachymyrmex cornetzi]|uniref:CCHC-type domain-containing protein n=1 Tax=Trachymyrmex cornetzi TaxID=471704 RepID=A0A151J087_9HYME|nr:hypothetical protein ALC57_12866 [Trachymyrmex cornetzi]